MRWEQVVKVRSYATTERDAVYLDVGTASTTTAADSEHRSPSEIKCAKELCRGSVWLLPNLCLDGIAKENGETRRDRRNGHRL